MIRILRFCAVLLLIGQSVAGEQPRLIAASDIATVLHEGTQVRIGTRSKRTVTGTTARVDLNGVAVQTGTQETHVPLGEIDWFRLTVSHGNKSTWLPLILCATVGAAFRRGWGHGREKVDLSATSSRRFNCWPRVWGLLRGQDNGPRRDYIQNKVRR